NGNRTPVRRRARGEDRSLSLSHEASPLERDLRNSDQQLFCVEGPSVWLLLSVARLRSFLSRLDQADPPRAGDHHDSDHLRHRGGRSHLRSAPQSDPSDSLEGATDVDVTGSRVPEDATTLQTPG